MLDKWSHGVYYVGAVTISIYVIFKLTQWYFRIQSFSKSMPVVPVIFPPASLFRRLLPRSWQAYHIDWYFHSKGAIYKERRSDVVALVSLFQYDCVCTRDANAFVEVKITDGARFPRDLSQFRMVNTSNHSNLFRPRFMDLVL